MQNSDLGIWENQSTNQIHLESYRSMGNIPGVIKTEGMELSVTTLCIYFLIVSVLGTHSGLPNLGNTCFMNSAIQLVGRTPLATKILEPATLNAVQQYRDEAQVKMDSLGLTKEERKNLENESVGLANQRDALKKQIENDNAGKSNAELQELYKNDTQIKALQEKIDKINEKLGKWNNAYYEEMRANILLSVAAVWKILLQASGSDAAGLSEAADKLRKVLGPALASKTEHSQEDAFEAVGWFLRGISEIPALQELQKFCELKVKRTSRTNTEYSLTLPLAKNDGSPYENDISLKQLVDAYKTHMLGGEILSTSGILFIGLNRLSEEKKIETSIAFPPVLKLEENDQIYHLIGVIVHFGGATGGLYYSYFKDLKNGKWYCYNDSHVTTVSEAHVLGLKSAATVLSYVKQSSVIALYPGSLPVHEFCNDVAHLESIISDTATPADVREKTKERVADLKAAATAVDTDDSIVTTPVITPEGSTPASPDVTSGSAPTDEGTTPSGSVTPSGTSGPSGTSDPSGPSGTSPGNEPNQPGRQPKVSNPKISTFTPANPDTVGFDNTKTDKPKKSSSSKLAAFPLFALLALFI